MIASFNYLFPEGLNDQGVYFVEDTHTNYLRNFRDTEHSFIEMAKCLADYLHGAYLPQTENPHFLYSYML